LLSETTSPRGGFFIYLEETKGRWYVFDVKITLRRIGISMPVLKEYGGFDFLWIFIKNISGVSL